MSPANSTLADVMTRTVYSADPHSSLESSTNQLPKKRGLLCVFYGLPSTELFSEGLRANRMEAELSISGMERALAGDTLRNAALTCPVLEVPIAVVTMAEAVQQVNQWISTATRAHLVTFVNAHMAVEAQLKPSFRRSLRAMDLNCPDGAPIFWLARKQHGRRVAKIAGPEFMPLFCEQSVALGHRHFLYGGTEGTAEEACAALRERYPGIQIAGHYCPPFRPLTADERVAVANTINESGADVVWVCLGCPKQEQWMSDMRDHLQAKVVLAVGQAFDIVAGRTHRAPALLRHCGAEWAYRLAKEPRRLWKRYLVTNVLFLLFAVRDGLDQRRDPAFQARSGV